MATELDSATEAARPTFPKRAIITGGMPYGNKNLHFGHIGGVFVPADFFARFLRDRIGAQNVVFVSGTDCFGSPIMEGYRKKVEGEGYTGTIEDYVRHNHDLQKQALDAYQISLDIFAGSGLEPAKALPRGAVRQADPPPAREGRPRQAHHAPVL
jgi:methionyl-tRNA synthetase